MIPKLLSFDASQSLVDSGIKLCSHRLHRSHIQPLQGILHLLEDQFHTRTKLLRSPIRLQRQLKIIHHAKKRLNGIRDRIVPRICPLLRLTLPRIIKLSLQTRQPVQQLVPLALQLLQLRRPRTRLNLMAGINHRTHLCLRIKNLPSGHLFRHFSSTPHKVSSSIVDYPSPSRESPTIKRRHSERSEESPHFVFTVAVAVAVAVAVPLPLLLPLLFLLVIPEGDLLFSVDSPEA